MCYRDSLFLRDCWETRTSLASNDDVTRSITLDHRSTESRKRPRYIRSSRAIKVLVHKNIIMHFVLPMYKFLKQEFSLSKFFPLFFRTKRRWTFISSRAATTSHRFVNVSVMIKAPKHFAGMRGTTRGSKSEWIGHLPARNIRNMSLRDNIVHWKVC